MIIAKLADLHPSDFPSENIRKAIRYAQSHDLALLPLGKTPIDGTKVYVNRQSYVAKPLKDCGIESHKNYLDLQIILKGTEEMAYGKLGEAKGVQAGAYDPVKDKIAYTGSLSENVILHAGECALLYPEDIHQPGAEVDHLTVEKAVIKIQIDF